MRRRISRLPVDVNHRSFRGFFTHDTFDAVDCLKAFSSISVVICLSLHVSVACGKEALNDTSAMGSSVLDFSMGDARCKTDLYGHMDVSVAYVASSGDTVEL